MLCDVLPRHTIRASGLWEWVSGLLAGKSLQEAAQGLPFALETFRALKVSMSWGMERVRTRLLGLGDPPASAQSEPLLQTFEHLRAVFGASVCPVADFQMHFQVPFLG